MLFKDVAKAGDWFQFDLIGFIINGMWRVEANDKKLGLIILPVVNDFPTSESEIREVHSTIQGALTLATAFDMQPISLTYDLECNPPSLRYYLTLKKDTEVISGNGDKDNPYKVR